MKKLKSLGAIAGHFVSCMHMYRLMPTVLLSSTAGNTND